ncbi:MAG: helix-hairpin-helix domain-containing protein [Planctomycetota bacterium]
MKRPPIHSQRRRGAILVLVMWLLMIVGLLVLGLSRSARVSASLGFGEVERVQAKWMARAGVEQALAVLADDPIAYDGQDDLWYDDPGVFDNVELATGFTYSVTAPAFENTEDAGAPRFGLDDESSRVSINAERPRQLRRLPDIERAQADAMLDWLDRNEAARPGGAERGYYNQLDFPYLIRNGAFRTHRELLLVKGIEPGHFFGEDGDLDGVLDRAENDADQSWPEDTPDRQLELGLAGYTSAYAYDLNVNPLGTQRLDLKNSNPSELIEDLNFTRELAQNVVDNARNADNLFDFVGTRGEGNLEDEQQVDEITFEWLVDNWEYLTLEEDERLPGKININTASREVLETIPGMNPTMAEAIVDHRASQGMFTGIGQLYRSNVLRQQQFERVADFVTVRSNVFRIVSEGRTPSGTSHTVAVIVDRGGDQPVILDWRQP